MGIRRTTLKPCLVSARINRVKMHEIIYLHLIMFLQFHFLGTYLSLSAFQSIILVLVSGFSYRSCFHWSGYSCPEHILRCNIIYKYLPKEWLIIKRWNIPQKELLLIEVVYWIIFLKNITYLPTSLFVLPHVKTEIKKTLVIYWFI